MTRLAACFLSWISILILAALPAHGAATELHGVTFDPTPHGEWRCGLTTDEMPGLAAERMTHPLAAGCVSGEARAFAVIVDLSDARYAMSAEQMAADAEDQLPTSWKVASKSYDVVSLPGGRTAAYSRLVGKGDGFTFVSGQTPMVAISLNVPLVFENESGTPQQAIAVFRVRSPLPAGASQRTATIDALDQTLRAWAGTAHPSSNRTISAREFERASSQASDAGSAARTAPAAAPAARPEPSGNERIAAAVTAALQGRATESDLRVLEETEKQFGQQALGSMAQSLREGVRRSSQQNQQRQILATVLDGDKEHANDVLSRFLIAAIESHDSAAVASAIKVATSRGWPLHKLNPAAMEKLAVALLKRDLSLATTEDARAFLEFPSSELQPLVLRARTVPPLAEIARRDREQWRMKDRRAPSKAAYLVKDGKDIGLLERQQTMDAYRYRPLTNLLDVAAIDP